jgi:hypothetical protein
VKLSCLGDRFCTEILQKVFIGANASVKELHFLFHSDRAVCLHWTESPLLTSMPNKNEHGENFLELGFDWYILVSIIPKSSIILT